MRAVLLAAAVVLVSQAVSARAEIITRCGASSGQAWYFASPFVPQDEVGWSKDTLSKGEFLLIVDGDKPDIVTTDVAGTRSSRAEGAFVMFVSGTKSGFKLVLLVHQTGTVEHFLFQLDRAGNGTVAWGSARLPGAFTLPQMKRPPTPAGKTGLSADARQAGAVNDGPRAGRTRRAPVSMPRLAPS